MDAHAQFYALVLRNFCIAFGHAALNLNSVTRGINDAGKFNQNSVAGPFDDTTPVFGNLWFPEFAPDGVDSCKSSFFVSAHKPAVTDNVTSKNGCQPPFGPRIGH